MPRKANVCTIFNNQMLLIDGVQVEVNLRIRAEELVALSPDRTQAIMHGIAELMLACQIKGATRGNVMAAEQHAGAASQDKENR